MSNVNVYQAGETVGIWSYIRDWDGVYTSPDQGVKVTLTDPTGTVILNAVAMTPLEAGKFYYLYNTTAASPLGWWRYFCKSQDGLAPDDFYVINSGGFQLV